VTVPHPSRPVRLAAAAAVAGLALGGCSMFSPQTTTNVTYAPSDGVQGESGDLSVRNVFLVTEERGAQADLVGAVYNESGETAQVQVLVREGGGDAAAQPLLQEDVEVDAEGSVSMGPQADEQLTVDGLDVVPGRTVEVTFIGAGGNVTLQAPVLDGSLPEYAELLGEDGGQGEG
jgi:hypothetical protein